MVTVAKVSSTSTFMQRVGACRQQGCPCLGAWEVPELWGQQAGSAQVSGPSAGPELSPLPCLADASLPALLPQPCTIRHLVTHYLDISCVPRRSFFELLSYFSTNELEREKLQEFSSAQGQEELYSYCNRPRRTTLEVGLGEHGKPAP